MLQAFKLFFFFFFNCVRTRFLSRLKITRVNCWKLLNREFWYFIGFEKYIYKRGKNSGIIGNLSSPCLFIFVCFESFGFFNWMAFGEKILEFYSSPTISLIFFSIFFFLLQIHLSFFFCINNYLLDTFNCWYFLINSYYLSYGLHS